ncbi:MAG: helix-turn-helix domain-containing protein [Lachnospiraceae bacterium]|nr:helix-turn-helix domain-containing protein [Lachnospiraceae bacterium]
MEKKPQKKLLSVDDVKTVLNIGRDKAYSLMRSPAFPSMQIGNTYRVSEDELNNWIDKNSNRHFKL